MESQVCKMGKIKIKRPEHFLEYLPYSKPYTYYTRRPIPRAKVKKEVEIVDNRIAFDIETKEILERYWLEPFISPVLNIPMSYNREKKVFEIIEQPNEIRADNYFYFYSATPSGLTAPGWYNARIDEYMRVLTHVEKVDQLPADLTADGELKVSDNLLQQYTRGVNPNVNWKIDKNDVSIGAGASGVVKDTGLLSHPIVIEDAQFGTNHPGVVVTLSVYGADGNKVSVGRVLNGQGRYQDVCADVLNERTELKRTRMFELANYDTTNNYYAWQLRQPLVCWGYHIWASNPDTNDQYVEYNVVYREL